MKCPWTQRDCKLTLCDIEKPTVVDVVPVEDVEVYRVRLDKNGELETLYDLGQLNEHESVEVEGRAYEIRECGAKVNDSQARNIIRSNQGKQPREKAA